MKKEICSVLIVGSLAFSSIAVQAGGVLRSSDGSPVVWRGEDPNEPVKKGYPQAGKGAGIGAIAGAVVAGPAGLVVGMAGGALVGHQMGMDKDLKMMQARINQLTRDKGMLEKENARMGANGARLEKELRDQMEHRSELLKLLTGSYALSIHFRTESSQIEKRYYPYLEHLRALVSQVARLDIHIAAHTDARGSQSYNEGLSERRAKAVSRYFETLGIESGRIFIKMHGERLAEYSETDREGNAFDRQVLITLCLKGAS